MQLNSVVEHHKSFSKFLYKTSNKVKYLQQSSNCNKTQQKVRSKKTPRILCVMLKILCILKMGAKILCC